MGFIRALFHIKAPAPESPASRGAAPDRLKELIHTYFMMASTTQQNSPTVGSLSDNEDMASTQEDKLEGLTPASSIASSPDATAEKRKPILQSIPAPPRLGIELSELFTENVVAKIWRVAVRELAKQVPQPSHLNTQH